MLIWENPHSTHTFTRTHTLSNAHIHSHVNICGDSRRRQTSRSEPHLLLDLPHTHTCTHAHGCSYFTLGPNQTWPGLSSSHTHTNNAHGYSTHKKKSTHGLATKEQPAHDGNHRQSVMAGWCCACSVSTPEILEHTLTHTHTHAEHTPRTERQVVDFRMQL